MTLCDFFSLFRQIRVLVFGPVGLSPFVTISNIEVAKTSFLTYNETYIGNCDPSWP